MWVDEADQAVVNEVLPGTGQRAGHRAGQGAGQRCEQAEGDAIHNWGPGEVWLAGDSCNVCYCPGDGGSPVCSREGCRARLARLQGGSGAASSPSRPALLAFALSLLGVVMLA